MIVEKIFLIIGWIAISPVVLRDCVIKGFKWIVRKIKRS